MCGQNRDYEVANEIANEAIANTAKAAETDDARAPVTVSWGGGCFSPRRYGTVIGYASGIRHDGPQVVIQPNNDEGYEADKGVRILYANEVQVETGEFPGWFTSEIQAHRRGDHYEEDPLGEGDPLGY